WIQLGAAAYIERADPLGRVELVPDDREQVHAQVIHVHWYFADRLRRVGVQGDPVAARDVANLGEWLERANLIVGVHDGDERRLRCDGRLHRRWIHHPPLVDRQIGHAEAVTLLEIATGGKHGRMLDLARDQVGALWVPRPLGKGNPLEREVV